MRIWLFVFFSLVASHRVFEPSESQSLEVVNGGELVQISFLDGSKLVGFDAADVVNIGGYQVRTRLCLIESLHSHDFEQSDGIVGFGASNMVRSASLLRTLSTAGRPSWGIEQAASYTPMPAIFAFTADETKGNGGGYNGLVTLEEKRKRRGARLHLYSQR